MTSRFQAALQKIDQANAQDPNKEFFQGKEYPKELLYSLRMSAWMDNLRPEAGEVLKLAARAQHICRWEVPRSTYPMDRTGYLKWRTFLYSYHAEKAAALLREADYDEATVQKISTLLLKQNIKGNPDMQLLEDVICLVFLENYFADFSKQHEEEKIIPIVQKTWKKMSEEGHRAALQLPMSSEAAVLVKKALSSPG
ncbi:MAG: DUF4202 domain-containing protein [Candidatus Omnitrophica bacterium]|nr:DUF4202 domain-containing protein [Candidatus Omnitrophota bacterium]